MIPKERFAPVALGDRLTAWEGEAEVVVITGASPDDLSFNTAEWPDHVQIHRVPREQVSVACKNLGGFIAWGFIEPAEEGS
jgi:hypothetical protein